MKPSPFDAAQTPLKPGVNLIEASAGTGKTFALAMLALRFVVEIGLPVERLLVVTFTKAATAELKDRIRRRLDDARRALRHPGTAVDKPLAQWLERFKRAPEAQTALAIKRLDLASLDFDRAGIFTIHGFCQRILREHALECGQLFSLELTDNLHAIRKACADDFWRKNIYPRPAWEVAVITACYATPDALLASVDGIPESIPVYPKRLGSGRPANVLKTAAERAALELARAASVLAQCWQEKTFKPSFREAFEAGYPDCKRWLEGCVVPPATDVLALLTREGLYNGLNGNQFRTRGKLTGAARKQAYLQQLAIDTTVFDALADALAGLVLDFRLAFLETLRTELDDRLQRLNLLAFDSLVTRLAEALQGAKGGALAQEIRRRYGAALIDEFQDTDSGQWDIFATLFAHPSHYLYLIGDPKQAIYKFRGADIYAYLKAQTQAGHRFTLDKNWRSHPGLVAAVNALFRREKAFYLDGLGFFPTQPAKTAEDGRLQADGRDLPPMMLWQLSASGDGDGYWRPDRKDAEQRVMNAVAQEIVALLSGGFRLEPGALCVNAKHIAVLVRTNKQADEYQNALRDAGVPSVLNNTRSVMLSQEAEDLCKVLQAVAHPGDFGLLRQALALDWFGMDGQALFRLIHDDEAWDVRVSRFLGYHQAWQKCGLMAMLRGLLAQEQVSVTLAQGPLAERRLTNLQHLSELLQQAAIEGHLNMMQTLDWFVLEINNADKRPGTTEQQQLRLESDADAVQIVTLHRAKGLEYPIVFCPSLWQRNTRLGKEKETVVCHENGNMIADLGSQAFLQRRAQALVEELAEDIRMAYVALTRAQYRCYLVWADARTKDHCNSSSLAWLMGAEFAEGGFLVQQTGLQGLCLRHPGCFDYRLLPADAPPSAQYRSQPPPLTLTARQLARPILGDWQMSSYTALSPLSIAAGPELPSDKSGESQGQWDALAAVGQATEWLPTGVAGGNAVHELLEKIPFRELADGCTELGPYRQVCRRYGLAQVDANALAGLLRTVVSTPLSRQDPGFCLMHLPESDCIKEMPFYLSMPTLATGQVNQILAGVPTVQALANKTMQGFLTGFIDLVCCYQGRYYLMDYKTHCLPDYSETSLVAAMRLHNYGLQYWLYALVLHRYLQNRLPGYRYESHFGGVRYLFVRGMQAAVPMAGVFRDRPDWARLEALAQVFAGGA